MAFNVSLLATNPLFPPVMGAVPGAVLSYGAFPANGQREATRELDAGHLRASDLHEIEQRVGRALRECYQKYEANAPENSEKAASSLAMCVARTGHEEGMRICIESSGSYLKHCGIGLVRRNEVYDANSARALNQLRWTTPPNVRSLSGTRRDFIRTVRASVTSSPLPYEYRSKGQKLLDDIVPPHARFSADAAVNFVVTNRWQPWQDLVTAHLQAKRALSVANANQIYISHPEIQRSVVDNAISHITAAIDKHIGDGPYYHSRLSHAANLAVKRWAAQENGGHARAADSPKTRLPWTP